MTGEKCGRTASWCLLRECARMNVRTCVAVVFALVAATVVSAAAKEGDGLAFVLNSADASISVLDVNTRTELRRIPVLREPHHMALTPDHQFLLIGDTSGNELLFLDPSTGELQRRMTMSDPY